jgi:hypothetical protein
LDGPNLKLPVADPRYRPADDPSSKYRPLLVLTALSSFGAPERILRSKNMASTLVFLVILLHLPVADPTHDEGPTDSVAAGAPNSGFGFFQSYSDTHPDSGMKLIGRWPRGACGDVSTSSEAAYLQCGPSFLCFDVRDTTHGIVTWEYFVGYTNKSIVHGSLLYILGNVGVLIFDLEDPLHPHKLSEIPLTPFYAGTDLAASDSILFVLNNSGHVLCFDTSDPSNPSVIANVSTGGNYIRNIVASGRHAFVSGFPFLWIGYHIDASNPESVSVREITEIPVGASHGGTIIDSLWIFDHMLDLVVASIADPTNLRLISRTSVGPGTEDIAVEDTLLFMVDDSGRVSTYGIGTPSHPNLLHSYKWHEPDFSMWPGSYSLAVKHSRIYVTNTLGMLDLQSSAEGAIEFKSFFASAERLGRSDTIPGGLLVSAGFSGLWTFNVSGEASPKSYGSIRTGGNCRRVLAAYPYAYVASTNEDGAGPEPEIPDSAVGLWVFNVARPDSPFAVHRSLVGVPYALARSGNLLFVSRFRAMDSDTTVTILDVSSPANPVIVGAIRGGYEVDEMAVKGTTIFLASSDSGLYLFDYTSPGNPVFLDRIFHTARGVLVADSIAFVHRGDSLMVVDISSLDSLFVISRIVARDPGGLVASPWVQMLCLQGILYWVGGGYWGAFDVQDPSHPTRWVNDFGYGGPLGLSSHGDTLFLSTLSNGLYAFVVDRPASISQLPNHNFGGRLEVSVFPNPVNGRFTVRISAPNSGRMTIDLFDILGRHVRSLFEGYMEYGTEFSQDVGTLASGVYLLQVNAGAVGTSKKLVVVK